MKSPLELVPETGTLNGDDEARVLLYESSMTFDGASLLTLRTFGRGMRLTAEQVSELRDWIEAWLDGI